MITTCIVRRNSLLNEAREVDLVFLLILILQLFHVVTDMAAVDAVTKSVSFQLTTVSIIANQSLRTERTKKGEERDGEREGEKEEGGMGGKEERGREG
jgi:hypothetical protein